MKYVKLLITTDLYCDSSHLLAIDVYRVMVQQEMTILGNFEAIWPFIDITHCQVRTLQVGPSLPNGPFSCDILDFEQTLSLERLAADHVRLVKDRHVPQDVNWWWATMRTQTLQGTVSILFCLPLTKSNNVTYSTVSAKVPIQKDKSMRELVFT